MILCVPDGRLCPWFGYVAGWLSLSLACGATLARNLTTKMPNPQAQKAAKLEVRACCINYVCCGTLLGCLLHVVLVLVQSRSKSRQILASKSRQILASKSRLILASLDHAA